MQNVAQGEDTFLLELVAASREAVLAVLLLLVNLVIPTTFQHCEDVACNSRAGSFCHSNQSELQNACLSFPGCKFHISTGRLSANLRYFFALPLTRRKLMQGSIFRHPKHCSVVGEAPQNCHKFVLFDSPKIANLMTLTHVKWTYKLETALRSHAIPLPLSYP